MKNKEDISETIEAYLANSLSSEDKIAFETRLQNEPDLAKALADEKALSNLLLENELFDLRDQMKADFQEANKSRLFKLKTIGVITAIAIVSAALFFVIPKTEQKEDSKILVENNALVDSSSRENAETEAITSALKEKSTKQEFGVETKSSVVGEEKIFAEEKIVHKEAEEPTKQIIDSEKIIQKTEKQDVVLAKPCTEKTIEAHFQTQATEKGQQNGAIKIQLAKENTASYSYSLNKEQGFVEKASFEHLAKGNYQIFAKSDDGCIHSLGETVVKETFCLSDYRKSFSPEFDPAWVVPVFENESAKVMIKDKTGTTVFETHHFSTSEISWDGNLSSGAVAVTGSYKVFISYQNGENCIATVTLFR